jgi:hypothetical protein
MDINVIGAGMLGIAPFVVVKLMFHEQIEQNIQFIYLKRETMDLAPSDIRQINTFYTAELRNKEKSPLVLYQHRMTQENERFQSVLRERRAGLDFSEFSIIWRTTMLSFITFFDIC